ncbi:hypothetical protein LPJ75_005718, partial [Coemansia sp. RSA 2598]
RSELQSRLEAKCAEAEASSLQLSEQSELKESYKAQIEELKRFVDEKQSRISELEANIQGFVASRDVASNQAKELAQSAEREIAALRNTVAEQLTELTAAQQKLADAVDAKERALARTSELQSELETISRSEAGSCARLAQLDAKLVEQQELVSSLREQVGHLNEQLLRAQNEGAERNAALQQDICALGSQISDKQSEIHCLEGKLSIALQDADAARAAYEKAQAEHRLLAEQAREAQKRLEKDLSEAKHELGRKAATIGDLQGELDAASNSASASQTKAQEEALATIEDLRRQVAASENELSETRSALEDSRSAAEKLEQARDKTAADIQTLKHMMVELASSKDKEIVELEESLKQREALLEASVRETVEKEEAVQLAEKLAATHLDRAVKAESDLEQAARSNAEAIERLGKERLELEKKLEDARLLEAELRRQQSGAESEISRLQLEIEQHEHAESDLEKSLEHMSDDLAKAQEEASLSAQRESDRILCS